jgi:uncharacterized glyoxalase superfamily protein PhnB
MRDAARPFLARVGALQCALPAMAARKQKQRHPSFIQLTVASVPRAIRFYEERLGFQLAERHPADKPVWASLVLEGQSVTLAELPSLVEARQFGMDQEEIEVLKQDARAFARGPLGVGASVYVAVADVDAFARKLKKRRTKALLAPKTQFYGPRELQVADLDGYRLVFYSPAEAPPPAATGDG